jgi:YHS domain-containing protein
MRNSYLVAALSLLAAACAGGEARITDQVSVTDQGVSVTKPAVPAAPTAPTVESAMQQITPSANYPTNTCIVSGEPLGATKVAYSYGGREVQFCCPGCVAKFMKSPDTYLAKLAK